MISRRIPTARMNGENLEAELELLCARRDISRVELAARCAAFAERVDEICQDKGAPEAGLLIGLPGPANLYLISDPVGCDDIVSFLPFLTRSRSNERHYVLISDLPFAHHERAARFVRDFGGWPLFAPAGLGRLDRLLWLRSKLLCLVPQRTFVLFRPDDPVALTATRWVKRRSYSQAYALDCGSDATGSLEQREVMQGFNPLPERQSQIAGAVQTAEFGPDATLDADAPASVESLFDTGYYLWANPDVDAASQPAIAHYVEVGRKTGRKGHPLFEDEYYLSQLPKDMAEDAAEGVMAHYLAIGEKLGYRPHPLFDPAYCRATMEAVGAWPPPAGAKQSVLGRYCEAGGMAAPHMLFDPMHYQGQLQTPMAGVALLIHFLEQGLPSRLSPHPLIDLSVLCGEDEDPSSAFLRYLCKSALSPSEAKPHRLFDPECIAGDGPPIPLFAAPNLLWASLIEGNVPGHNPHPFVDAGFVAASLPDVLLSCETILAKLVANRLDADTHPLISAAFIAEQLSDPSEMDQHATVYYLDKGTSAGIDPHPYFAGKNYEGHVTGEKSPEFNALLHYLKTGEASNLQPHGFFDVAHYRQSSGGRLPPGKLLFNYARSGAGRFVEVQPLDGTYRMLLDKLATRSFEAGDRKGSVAYLSDSLHREWAVAHPTLIAETRAVTLVGQIDRVLAPEAGITVAAPAILSRRPMNIPAGHYVAPQATVGTYDDCTVVGGNDGFITADGTWCDHGLVGFDNEKMTVKHMGAIVAATDSHVLVRRHSSPRHFDTAIFGCGTYALNYFHFIHEVIPRVLLAADQAPAGTPVLVNDEMPSQHYQALRFFLPDNPAIRLPRNISFRVRQLFAASMPTIVHDAFADAVAPTDSVRYHPAALARVRAAGAPFLDKGSRRKLFLRRDSAYRKLLNIDELEEAAISVGFESIRCEALDFAEQVRIFSTASVIVGPTGAQLTNMVFAPSDAHIVPLYSDAPGNNYYLWAVMADLLGQKSTVIAGARVRGSVSGRTPEAHEDFTVEPETLMSVLLGG